MKWFSALKIWNTTHNPDNKNVWCVPRKRTHEYYQVLKIMGERQDKSATVLQAVIKRKLTPKMSSRFI